MRVRMDSLAIPFPGSVSSAEAYPKAIAGAGEPNILQRLFLEHPVRDPNPRRVDQCR
jgi:hypothetical protein